MGAYEAVGCARVDLQGRVLDDVLGQEGRVGDRHDLVIVAVEDQCRDVELLEVFRHVRLWLRDFSRLANAIIQGG